MTIRRLFLWSVLPVGMVGVLALAGLSPIPAGSDALRAGQPAGGVPAGERVFRANCAMCHGPDAAGMMGMHPSLRGAIGRLSREGVEVTIRKGRNTMPPMPPFEGRLSDHEIADVVAYIASLPEGPRNFGPGDGMGGMMGGRERGERDGGIDTWIVWATAIALGAALATVALLLLRQRRPAPVDNARAVLDRRYAAGELTRRAGRRCCGYSATAASSALKTRRSSPAWLAKIRALAST